MFETGTPIAPPEWVSKLLATIDTVSGYTFALLAVACGLILWLPSPILGIDLNPVRLGWSAWIALALVFFASLSMAKVLRTAHAAARNASKRRSARREREAHVAETARRRTDRERDILRHLDTLSDAERHLLARCIASGERGIVGSYINGPLVLLTSKGIFEMRPNPIFTPARTPYLIPEFVWVELQRRRNEFPYDPNSAYSRNGWMAH